MECSIESSLVHQYIITDRILKINTFVFYLSWVWIRYSSVFRQIVLVSCSRIAALGLVLQKLHT